MNKEAQPVTVAGQALKCSVCGNMNFHTTSVRLNHRWTSFFDIEWIGKWGTAYICSNCGLKQEFYDAKTFGKGYHRFGVWAILAIVLLYLVLFALGVLRE